MHTSSSLQPEEVFFMRSSSSLPLDKIPKKEVLVHCYLVAQTRMSVPPFDCAWKYTKGGSST
jgi:hypothetical protein